MAYCAYVTELKNVRAHPNADRLMLADCFGNTVVVGLDAYEGERGIYFPTDGQLSVEFAEVNNLLRKKDDAGNSVGGYLDPDKRNIRAIKLRGERSDGIFLKPECLSTFGDISTLQLGDTIDVFNGHLICCKYIPKTTKVHKEYVGNKKKKVRQNIAPTFYEHKDTEQLAYNLSAFKPGDYVEISLKLHGTSHRTGYLPVITGYKRSIFDRIFKREGTPVFERGYVSGTRRTILENYEGGYYGDNAFREKHSKKFEGKLWEGETVYLEIVGFTNEGTPIMADCANKKLNDKEFVKQYGETTRFSYNCRPDGDESELYTDNGNSVYATSSPYVYRMTMTTSDGNVVEYTPDFMRYRCEQMGVRCVPVLWSGIIPNSWVPDGIPYCPTGDEPEFSAGEWIKKKAEEYYDGPDPIGKEHVREGVVVRIVNRPTFTAFKHKNWSFKCLEGIVKAEAEAPDMEEAESIQEEEECEIS